MTAISGEAHFARLSWAPSLPWAPPPELPEQVPKSATMIVFAQFLGHSIIGNPKAKTTVRRRVSSDSFRMRPKMEYRSENGPNLEIAVLSDFSYIAASGGSRIET